MRRTCEVCGVAYEAKTARSRVCSERCKKRKQRAGSGQATVPLRDALSVLEATRQTLEAADRLTTPAGASALVLAAKLDAAGDTGSAMAALSKQHLAVLDEATRGARVEVNPLDELRERREARLRGA